MSNNESSYISKEDLADGYKDLPKVSLVTQRNLRANKKIRYTKVGRTIYYKYEWVKEYLEKNEKNNG